ncbi:hypothetical protein Btru_068354 [Bulinus truncatus]|nr:hypothetical protein Btru_068354 [Bulinus truncatus]
MEDSGYYSKGAQDLQVCSSSDSANSIFNLKFSELPTSKYNYFLYGFKDERDFEEFKQDLRDFQQLKRNCLGSDQKADSRLSYAALKEDLELICRPNRVFENRRRHHNDRDKPRHRNVTRRTTEQLVAEDQKGERPLSGSSKTPITEEAVSKPDPFGLRADFDRRSGVFGFDRRSGISCSIKEILMDFINGDEHFQEFERVFNTVNKTRMDNVKSSPGQEILCRQSGQNNSSLALSEQSRHSTGSDMKRCERSSHLDLFSDFFDNDETFLEFEKEFENFRNAKKTNFLANLGHMGSSRDIFGDVKSYCDRNVKSGSQWSVNRCTSEDEATPSCPDDHGQVGLIWHSVEDWEKILKKMKRNSLLLLDGCSHRPVYGLSQRSAPTKRYLKTQSLADLTGCHAPETDHRYLTDVIDSSRTGYSYSVNDLSLPASMRFSPSRCSDSSSSFAGDVDDAISTSSSRWSEQLNGGSHYSSSSTLCSSRDDLSCSLSCSCCSDLHIDEDTDDELSLPYSQSPSSRNRSHSLMDIGHHVTHKLQHHTCSVDNLLCLSRTKNGRFDSDRTGAICNKNNSHDISPLRADQLCDSDEDEYGPEWSCQLSDVDSEQYHTASSDFSNHFSTAKSDLSSYVTEHRGRPDTGSRLSLTESYRPVTSGFYHSYHGQERRKTFAESRRPLSVSACQYTCHQHCIPAVTLNCKSVSEDSVQVKTPTPTEPRSQLETSLSLGSIHARPGCARSVTLTNSQDSQQHLVACTLAHGAQGIGIERDLTNRSGPSSPYLSRSASEGYVTAQSSLTSSNVSRPTTLTSKYNPSLSNLCTNINPQAVHTSSGLASKDNVLISEQLPQVDSSCKGVSSIINATDHITEQDISTRLHGPEGEEATEKDETDSGYRSGTIPDDKLPRVPSQDTLDRQELKRKIAKFNHFVPSASFQADKESFQGFMKVTLNLIRPITMELGARPPSIYELLTREHIVEENTQQVAFYMPRDTHKSLHITSETTTKEVVSTLLKKFHIIDHPRKFAMYEQEFSDRNKLVRLRRLTDKDFPLRAMLTWDPERIKNYRMVLQENETGEIVWDAFSLPELNNFLKVLDREEKETILELKHKYAYMRQYMERRLTELRHDRNKAVRRKNVPFRLRAEKSFNFEWSYILIINPYTNFI